MEEELRKNPRHQSFIKICELYAEYMFTKKTVALFTDYNKAKNDVLFELYLMVKDSNKRECDMLKNIVELFIENTDHEEYWLNDIK